MIFKGIPLIVVLRWLKMAETYQTCRHFRRHYVKMGWRYDPISQGHCVYPRLKPRRADTPACPYYRPREDA